MKTLIRNNTQSPVHLPLPYTGILTAGEGVVIDEPPQEVSQALFDNKKSSLANLFNLSLAPVGSPTGSSNRASAARRIGQALAKSAIDIEVNNVRLRRVGTPTEDTDAATKIYVDGIRQALQSQIAAIPTWVYGERYFELGDYSTGTWYVTVSARAASNSAFQGLAAVKHNSSVAGELGTFAVMLTCPVGVVIQSVTLFTYTRRETQPRIVLMMDNPQGARYAHQFIRPSVTQFPPTNAQQVAPTVSVADAAGSVPTTYGIVGQLDPTKTYPKIRVVATGFFAAGANAVSDHFYNKPQSLVVQF